MSARGLAAFRAANTAANAKGYKLTKRAFTSRKADAGPRWCLAEVGQEWHSPTLAIAHSCDTMHEAQAWLAKQPDRPFRPVTLEDAAKAVPAPEVFADVAQDTDDDTTPEPSTKTPTATASLDAALGAILEHYTPKAPSIDEKAVQAIVKSNLAEWSEKIIAKVQAIEPRRVVITTPTVTVTADDDEHEMFHAIVEELAAGNNLFISGPQGSGKTTAIEHAGVKLGLKVFLIPPPSDPYELFGFRDAQGNYQSSPLWRALTCNHPALVVFDEIDRSDPKALCAAHPVTAGNGIASFPHEQIPIPDTLRIAATGNTWGLGANALFVGACKLDDASLSRMPRRLLVDYDHRLEKRVAMGKFGATSELVDRCFKVRANLRARGIKLAWTPRDTFAMARATAISGLTIERSFERSVLCTLDAEQRKAVLA